MNETRIDEIFLIFYFINLNQSTRFSISVRIKLFYFLLYLFPNQILWIQNYKLN